MTPSLRNRGLAASLVVAPLLYIPYWTLYPAYGLLKPETILTSIAGDPGRTGIADIFAFAGAFLAIPATLALMRVLRSRSPKLAAIGGTMGVVGWIAIIGTLMGDVVAIEFGRTGKPSADLAELYTRFATNPFVLALNGLAIFHIIGSVLLGIGLWRARIIPKWAGIVAIVAAPIHFASNIAGVLYVDLATWIAIAAAYATVIPYVMESGDRVPNAARVDP